MRIYTRDEIGLKPPRSVLGCRKKYFVIHHTASPNCDNRTFEQDASLQRMWQAYHMSKYGAKDILNTFSVMRSGRILEGRMPWDSDGGAAYNAGTDGFGIENEGTYYSPGVYMGETQLASLAWLCAEAHKRVGVPLVFRGHKTIPGNSTACPGNLQAQLIDSGLLEKRVRALLKGEAEMSSSRTTTSRTTLLEGHAFIGKNGNCTENCWLHITNFDAPMAHVGVRVMTDLIGKSQVYNIPLNKHQEVDLARFGVPGTITWRISSEVPVVMSPDWRVWY